MSTPRVFIQLHSVMDSRAFALKDKLSYLTFHDTILGESDQDIKAYYKNNPLGDTSGGLPEHSDAIQVGQEMYAAENRRWSKPFEPLYRVALHKTDESDSLKSFSSRFIQRA